LPAEPVKPPSDKDELTPARVYEVNSSTYEAYPAGAARANNHAGGNVLQLQDSSTIGRIFARLNTLASAEWVSA